MLDQPPIRLCRAHSCASGNVHFCVTAFMLKGHCVIRFRLVPKKPHALDNEDT